jgi:hypothetical protein
MVSIIEKWKKGERVSETRKDSKLFLKKLKRSGKI